MNPFEQAFISALGQSPTLLVLGIVYWLEMRRSLMLERRLDESHKAHINDLRPKKTPAPPNLGDD